MKVYLAIPKIWDTLWGDIEVFSVKDKATRFIEKMNRSDKTEATYVLVETKVRA